MAEADTFWQMPQLVSLAPLLLPLAVLAVILLLLMMPSLLHGGYLAVSAWLAGKRDSIWYSRGVRLRLMILMTLVFAAVSLDLAFDIWMESDAAKVDLQYIHMSTLSRALAAHYDEYSQLPESLDAAEATGLFGSRAYRGPYGTPNYLPVLSTEPPDGFIIAIGAPAPSLGSGRHVVRFGEATINFVYFHELAQLLAEDDAKRRTIGETRLWEDVAR